MQYYLDFFQDRGRERMAIWLTRMPRYETMIRERLQRENLPGDLVYLALIESGFSNTATSRAKAVGMWQFMKGTGKGYGLRVDSWVDERRDPFRGHRCRGAASARSQPAVRLALSGGRRVQRGLGQGVARAESGCPTRRAIPPTPTPPSSGSTIPSSSGGKPRTTCPS